MKWLALVVILGVTAIVGPLLLLLVLACFIWSAAVAVVMAAAEAGRCNVYIGRQ